MRLRIMVLALAVLLGLTAAAAADDFQFEGKTLSLTPPAGHCALDRSDPDEANIINMLEAQQKGTNSVALQFASCSELADWHARRIDVLSHYGQIMLPLSYQGAPRPLRLSRQEYLDIVAPAIPQVDAAAVAKIESKLNTRMEDTQISGLQNLGVLDRNSDALYVGIVVVVERDGQKFPRILIAAPTMLSSIPVTVNLFSAPKEGAIDQLIATQKTYIAELVRRNP